MGTNHVALSDALVVHPFIAEALDVNKHLLLAVGLLVLPGFLPPASEAPCRQIQRLLFAFKQPFAEVVLVVD